MLVFLFLPTCVGLTIGVFLAALNLVLYETVCCFYFREGFRPVSPQIVLLLLTSIKDTLSGPSFLSGLALLQFGRRCCHFNASDLCVTSCLSVYDSPAHKTTIKCEV